MCIPFYLIIRLVLDIWDFHILATINNATTYTLNMDMLPGCQRIKNLPAMWETWVRLLGWEDALEKGMATHDSNLAWRILWRNSGRL